MKMKMKRIMGFFLALVMFIGYLPLNPIASYANGDVEINETNFEDKRFKHYVKDNFDEDKDGNLSKVELDKVGRIVITNKSVSSLKGIEHFKNLTHLDCSSNNLKSLDVSKNTKLTKLYCSGNKLESLDISKNTNLTHLSCVKNKLESLDVSKNTNLTDLRCYENNLTSLDVSKNTNLTYLDCYENNLTSLDVSNIQLQVLYCTTQQYNITVNKGIREFKYSNFPGQFNKDKVTSPVGASFGDDALTFDSDTTNEVTYNYKVGNNKKMDVKLKVTYFDPENVESMVVKTQPKLSYTEGEKLDLTGLVVTLTDKQGTAKDVAFKDFKENNIIANPKNETELTLTDSEKPVTLTKGSLQAETANLTVNEKAFDPENVKSMVVKTQPKLVYTEGEKLDLTGLVVTLTNNQGLTKDVAFKNFKENNIIANPKNETELTLTDSGKPVTLTKGSLQDETENLTVNEKVFDPENDDVKINYTNFEDENFINFVKANFDTDKDGNLSKAELDKVKEIYIGNKSVSSLKGIEHFKNLTKLDCSNNKLESLDISKNTNLTELDCSNNELTSLNLSKNTNLTKLTCYDNNLESLDVSKNTNLTELRCFKNNLTSLDVSKNINLNYLGCSNNKLKSLDVSNNTELTGLDCSDNKLKSLDISNNTKLTYLRCSKSNLTSLDVSKNINITELYCEENNLTSLDVSNNTKLTYLHCHKNKLESLDVSKNTKLTEFYCYINNLTSLDVSKNTKLTEFYCYINNLTSLDVSKNTKLTGLSCHSNNLTSLDVSKNTKLTILYCDNQQYNITVNKGIREFKYSKFPGQFNKDKVTSPDGASFGEDALTFNSDNTNEVTYNYKVGNNIQMDVKLNVTYIEFDPEHVESMVVKTQPKLIYTEGEKLDLAGLVVTLTDKQGLTKDVEFKDFKENNITANPENETELKLADSGKKVTLTKGNLTAQTNALTVNEKETPSPSPKPTDPNGGKPAETKKYYTVTFVSADETKGTVAKENTFHVLKTENKTLADITAPKVTAKAGYEFDKWNPASDKNTVINKDMTVKAYFKQKATPTQKKPPVVGTEDPNVNPNPNPDQDKYWTVTFKADPSMGTIDAKNTVYVLKNSGKTLADLAKDAPKVTAKAGFKFTGWEPALDANTTINKDMTVNAKFGKVTPTPTPTDPPVDPKDPPVVRPVDPTQPGGKSQVDNNKALPKTASSMNIELYTIFMILSGALLVVAFKRKKESQ